MCMRLSSLIFLLTLICAMNVYTQTAEKFAAIWEKEHISRIAPSDVHHADLRNYLEQLKKTRARRK